jgi:hypothetical protein
MMKPDPGRSHPRSHHDQPEEEIGAQRQQYIHKPLLLRSRRALHRLRVSVFDPEAKRRCRKRVSELGSIGSLCWR